MQFNHDFYAGQFGLERETLRIDKNGRLAQTPHPSSDPHITRDYGENQIELMTPVCHSVEEALASLAALDKTARETLDRMGEQIWLYSNPPHFETEDEIPVADFRGEHASKRNYRELLERRYGKRLMLYSGIHFNFSFSEAWLHELQPGGNDQECKNAFYLRLYKQLCVHSWLLVLLTAASPVYDKSLDEDNTAGMIRSRYASMRNSERGYWNEFIPILDHTDLGTFTDSIQYYIDKGALFSASELYLPIRLKPRGINTLDNLAKNGVDHIELRMFDLNPLTPLGIAPEDAEFAHLLILYLSQQEDFTFTPAMQEEAIINHQNAALYDLHGVTIHSIPILEQANTILDHMYAFFEDNDRSRQVITYERQKLQDPISHRITGSIYQIKE